MSAASLKSRPTPDDALIEVALEESREKMHRAIEHTKSEFAVVRTGRASPSLVERLKIDYFFLSTRFMILFYPNRSLMR